MGEGPTNRSLVIWDVLTRLPGNCSIHYTSLTQAMVCNEITLILFSNGLEL